MDDQRRTKTKKRKPKRVKQKQLIDEYWYEEENGRIEEAKDLSWVDCLAEMAGEYTDKLKLNKEMEYQTETTIHEIMEYKEERM